MRNFLETNGGLATALIAGSLLSVPILGWLPVFCCVAAIGTSICIDERIHRR